MEGTQCRAMAHTEYRRSREPFAHQSIEPCLRSLVNRRCRLVEKEPIGLLDQRSSEGDALLLAGESWSAPMIRSFAGSGCASRRRKSATLFSSMT